MLKLIGTVSAVINDKQATNPKILFGVHVSYFLTGFCMCTNFFIPD